MNSLLFIPSVFFLWGFGNCFQNENEPLQTRIIGHWKEDQLTRTNLNDFLYNVGVSWIRRQIATTVSWENDQIFKADGTGLDLQMTNGPGQCRARHVFIDFKPIFFRRGFKI